MRGKRFLPLLATSTLILSSLVSTAAAAELLQVYTTQTPPPDCTLSTGQVFADAYYVVVYTDGSCTASVDPPQALY